MTRAICVKRSFSWRLDGSHFNFRIGFSHRRWFSVGENAKRVLSVYLLNFTWRWWLEEVPTRYGPYYYEG